MLKTSVRDLTSELSLLTNFSWIFVGNLVYAGCQWAMLVVLAKFGSPEMVGQFALGLAITAPVIMFTNLHLRSIQATDSRREFLFGHYLGLRLISTPLALLITAGIIVLSGYHWEISLIILAIAVAKAFESISDVFYGLLQQHEQMDRIAKSMILKGLVSLVALASGLYLSGSLFWGIIGLVITWALILFGYDVRSSAMILQSFPRTSEGRTPTQSTWAEPSQPIWNTQKLQKLAWLAFPLGVVMMLNSLNINIPRYMIERYLGERELGIFAAMAYVMVAGSTVIDAIGQSSSPRLAKYYAIGNLSAFRRLLLKLIGIGALMGGIGVLIALFAGQEVLILLYRLEYSRYADVFLWLLIGTGIGYISSLLGYAIMAARYFRIQIPLNLVFIMVLTVASMFLIPTYNLLGAAWGTCIAFAFQLPLKCLVIVYALKERAMSNLS
jgi:O-antigen/teichoic acid export membrane protein